MVAEIVTEPLRRISIGANRPADVGYLSGSGELLGTTPPPRPVPGGRGDAAGRTLLGGWQRAFSHTARSRIAFNDMTLRPDFSGGYRQSQPKSDASPVE